MFIVFYIYVDMAKRRKFSFNDYLGQRNPTHTDDIHTDNSPPSPNDHIKSPTDSFDKTDQYYQRQRSIINNIRDGDTFETWQWMVIIIMSAVVILLLLYILLWFCGCCPFGGGGGQEGGGGGGGGGGEKSFRKSVKSTKSKKSSTSKKSIK